MEQQLQAALAYQQISFEQTKYALREIINIVQQLYELEYSGKPIALIQQQRPFYQLVISGLKVKLERLLQEDNGQKLDGSNSDSNSGREFRQGLGSGKE
jgi:hypothetical protein